MSETKVEKFPNGFPKTFERIPDAIIPPFTVTPITDIGQIHARLNKTWANGKTLPLKFRREQLTKLYYGIIEESPLVVEALSRDFKGLFDAVIEVQVFLSELASYLEDFESWVAPVEVPKPMVSMMDTAQIVYEPYGVVLGISPWNYPFSLALVPAIGAIASGNCFVFKPSEMSPNTSAIIEFLVTKYLDPDCFAVINGDKDVTTKALELKWDFISYTGNSTVGRIVMTAAANHLTPVLLELGGKSPAIIDDRTCDLRIAARRIVWARFINGGQICIAADYIICRPEIREQLVKILQEEIISFYSDDPKTNAEWPRIVNQHHTKRIVDCLPTETSPPGHGRIAYGGKFNIEDRFIEPTVLVDVDPLCAPIMQSEIFGPVLPIIEMEDIDSAIKYVKSKSKPLALYIFSDDKEFIGKVTSQISSGGVCINDTLMHHTLTSLPFGGVGESGMGSCHGRHSIEQFSHKRALYQANNYRKMESIVKLRYPGTSIPQALAVFFQHNLYPRPPDSSFINRSINTFVSTIKLLYNSTIAFGGKPKDKLS